MKSVVNRADPLKPFINEAFMEYAQTRGFVIDTCRVRHADDKPRVERAVSYVRDSFFAGEDFSSFSEAQSTAEHWCLHVAGERIHGTTCRRPLDAFSAVELHVVPEVVEAELIVGAISDVSSISALSFLVAQMVKNNPHRQTEKLVYTSHPLGIPAG